MSTRSAFRPSRKTGQSVLKILFQFVRFSLVGGLNTSIDIVVFNLLVWIFQAKDIPLVIACNTLAYATGALNSFLLNKHWTFQQRTETTGGQVMHFALVTSLGMVCNGAFLWLAMLILDSFSLQSFFWTNVAKVSAIAGSVMVSYLGMRFGVFTREEEQEKMLPVGDHPLLRTPRSLSVILPAYNEESVIEQTLVHVMQTLTRWMQDFEVIVVNDGSRDRTGAIVARLATCDRRIRVIHHERNKGYGAALVSGFAAATKELVFFMDADGQFEIRDLARFFPLIEEFDAVFGYRLERQDSWMRKLNAWGWRQLVRFVFGIRVRDIDCAFKLFHAAFFRAHPLETRGAMINTEIIYKLARAGGTYTEVGVRHLPRRGGRATGAKLGVIVRALREMVLFAEKWRQEEQEN